MSQGQKQKLSKIWVFEHCRVSQSHRLLQTVYQQYIIRWTTVVQLHVWQDIALSNKNFLGRHSIQSIYLTLTYTWWRSVIDYIPHLSLSLTARSTSAWIKYKNDGGMQLSRARTRSTRGKLTVRDRCTNWTRRHKPRYNNSCTTSNKNARDFRRVNNRWATSQAATLFLSWRGQILSTVSRPPRWGR